MYQPYTYIIKAFAVNNVYMHVVNCTLILIVLYATITVQYFTVNIEM